jgi:hypothetical protein
MQDFTGAEARVGQDQEQSTVTSARECLRASLKHGADFILGGHLGECPRRPDSESVERVLSQGTSLYGPTQERLQASIGLVYAAVREATFLQLGKEPAHRDYIDSLSDLLAE